MTLLSLHNVERAYGERIVFAEASIRIDARDRIGVIGDNGSGKTTLLRVLVGEDPPDAGSRECRRDLRIAWTRQIPVLPPGMTVLAATKASFGDLAEMEAELRRLEHAMVERPDDARLQQRHDRVHTAFEKGGGYDRDRLAETALMGLGFGRGVLGNRADILSGGEKARLALARAMLLPADLLVLDEPTNHLDLEGLAFLEDWLLERGRAFVVVSHDRRFLDRVCTSIVEVDGGKVTRYPGDYSSYRTQKERELKTAAREFHKQADFIAREMAYIRKHMGGRWTAQAKGRLKRLERIKRLAGPSPRKRSVALELGKKARGLAGQCVVEGHGLGVQFGDLEPLFENVDLRIYHGDRIGILGRNGAGKSTLLELLAGSRTPSAGWLERAKTQRLALFTQEMGDLPASGSALASFMALVPHWTEGECRDHLARFLFQGDDVEADVQSLSGGEKRRLCLARLLVSPADLYLMDEPTNHLDISTRETLEDALADFPGTVVLVSHDRHFLERTVQRVFELRQDGIRVYEGGIAAWEEAAAAERRRAAEGARARRSAAPPSPQRASPRADGEPAKIRNPYAFEKLEQRIYALEEELAAVHVKLSQTDSWKQPADLKNMQQREREIRRELSGLYQRWENWQ